MTGSLTCALGRRMGVVPSPLAEELPWCREARGNCQCLMEEEAAQRNQQVGLQPLRASVRWGYMHTDSGCAGPCGRKRSTKSEKSCKL